MTRKSDPLIDAAAVGVTWSLPMRKALAILETAKRRKSEAAAMVKAGRGDIEEARLARKAEHDAEQAAKNDPADFEAFAEPQIDLGLLHDIAAAYDAAARKANRDVIAEAGDYSKNFARLDKAWRELPTIDPEKMTVATAAGIQAERDAGRSILRQANFACAKAAGMTEQARKAMLSEARKDPSRLPNLDVLEKILAGQSPEAIARERALAEKRKTEAAERKRTARQNAQSRKGGKVTKADARAANAIEDPAEGKPLEAATN